MKLTPETITQRTRLLKVNINNWLREFCANPRAADQAQRALDAIPKYLGAIAFGGYLEDREFMWKGTYLDKTQNYIHLGVDINLPAGSFVYLPFEVTVIDKFVDSDTDIGWGGRLIVQRKPGYHAIVLGHLKAGLPEVGEVMPAYTPLGIVAPAPHNGNVFEHLHIQLVHPSLVLPVTWKNLDGYGKVSDAWKFPDPFNTEL